MYTYKHLKAPKSAVTTILICLALIVWGILGSTDTSLARKGRGKTLYLNVDFRDDYGDRIKSDNNGLYKDGEDNVVALARDRFRFDTTRGAESHKGGKRTVTMDFPEYLLDENGQPVTSPLDGQTIEVPMDMRLCYKWEDGVEVLDEFPDVDGMPVDPQEPVKVTMCIHFSYDGDTYGLAFGNLYQSHGEVDPGTDPVTVTRTEDEKWEIEAPPDAMAGLHSLVWKEGNPLYGYTKMPFMVTLEVQEPKGGKKAPPAPNLSSELTSTWGRIKAER